MANKTVIVEMPEDLAAWLQLNPALGTVRVIGEFVPTTPLQRLATPQRKTERTVEYDSNTRFVCQHRPPETRTTCRAIWDHLRDKFGDMVITRADATESVVAANITTRQAAAPAFTQMLRKREMRPIK